jgi:hypothetical protein
MTEDPLIDDLRAASHFGCRVREAQILAMGHRLKGRLKPAGRRRLRAACDSVARSVAVWRLVLRDEPEIVADLETLDERLHEFQPRATR